MAHIHTNPGEHDHTASGLIIRTDTSEPRLLLHMHKKLGVLLQPGGHIELTETPWQAVSHEITEETGYQLSQLKILQPTIRMKKLPRAVLHPHAAVHNTHYFDPEGIHRHSDLAYAFITTEDPAGKPAAGESVDLRWMSIHDLENLPASQIYEDVRQIGVFVLTQILSAWEPVDLSEFDS